MSTTITADIAEVEEEIDGITSIVHRHWIRRARLAVEDVDAELRRDHRGRDAAIVALLWLLIRRRANAPMTPRARAMIRASAARLLFAGARTVGVGGPALSALILGPVSVVGGIPQAEAAVRELEFMSRARVVDSLLADRVERVIVQALEDLAKIAPGAPPLLPDVPVAPPVDRHPRPIPAQNTPIITPPPPVEPKNEPPKPVLTTEGVLIGLAEDLARVLSDPNAALSRTIVDAWAYRQHNVGTYQAAKTAGVKVLVAVNNPPGGPDSRTTDFCRWVNGKVIKIERVDRQLAAFNAAVAAQDKAAMIQAWKFIPLSKKGMKAAREDLRQDRAPGARISDAEVFRNYFVTVGLPPYHWRCRTVVETQ